MSWPSSFQVVVDMSDTCLQEQSTQDCTVACMVDRMVPITVQNSHMEKKPERKRGREGASDESTDGSDIAKWCAGIKHP
ncbi:hypothetical protein F7725_012974, partial [Dissostichus mawsoni]